MKPLVVRTPEARSGLSCVKERAEISAFWNFRVRHFGGPEDKRSGHSGVEDPKSQVVTELDVSFGFQKSGFRIPEVLRIRSLGPCT
jgi:hypothetical protein